MDSNLTLQTPSPKSFHLFIFHKSNHNLKKKHTSVQPIIKFFYPKPIYKTFLYYPIK